MKHGKGTRNSSRRDFDGVTVKTMGTVCPRWLRADILPNNVNFGNTEAAVIGTRENRASDETYWFKIELRRITSAIISAFIGHLLVAQLRPLEAS